MVHGRGESADWRRLLEEPGVGSHSVQFYKDPAFLIEAVVHFITAGIARREASVLIMTAPHVDLLRRRLTLYGWDLAELEKCCGLRLLEAEATLDRFMRGGSPDESAFFEAVTPVVQEARKGFSTRVRAFGEMVDVLWRRGEQEAALKLEELWNRLIAGESLVLHCAYDADVFDAATHCGQMCGVHHTHTHVITAEDSGALDCAVDMAMREVFGPLAGTLLRPSLGGEGASTLHLLRGLTSKLPDAAEAVLRRARTHYSGTVAYTGGA